MNRAECWAARMIGRTAIAVLLFGAAVAVAPAVDADEAKVLKVGVQNLPPSVDPGRDYSNHISQLMYNTFDSLIDKDPTKVEAVWRPGIATSWKQLSPTEFELKIRQGVKFQNGDPLTVEDVVFSLDRIINPTFAPYKDIKLVMVDNLSKVEAVDSDTVRVTAAKPEPLFEALLNLAQLAIVPKKYILGLAGDPNKLEDADFEAFALKPIATGPYKIAEFVPGQRVVYERFDGFWGEKAPFERIIVTKINELSARITALENGEADLITNVPPDQIATIENSPKLKVEGINFPIFHVVMLNTQNPKMADPRIRQALSLAIDRNLLNQALWGGKAVVPSSHTFPQYGPLYMPDLKTFGYDPEKAKALLKEAGYNGYAIRYDTFPNYYTNGLLAAQAIKEMWAAVGVPMEINVTDQWTGTDPTMMTRNSSEPMYFPDPVGSFGIFWGPSGDGASQGHYRPDAAFVATYDRFRHSADLEERKKLYVELMAAIKNDPPMVPLYQPYESYGMTKILNWKPLPGHIPYVLDFRAGMVSTASN